MLEEELLRRLYERPELNAIIDALKTLHHLGVFKHQAKEHAMRICEGFNEQPPEELAKQILQVQQTNRNLLALHELAGNLQKDESNA